MKRQFGYLILAMIMTTGCKDAGVGAGLDEVSTECSTAATCPAGHDCQDGICLLLCSDDSHCTGSEVSSKNKTVILDLQLILHC